MGYRFTLLSHFFGHNWNGWCAFLLARFGSLCRLAKAAVTMWATPHKPFTTMKSCQSTDQPECNNAQQPFAYTVAFICANNIAASAIRTAVCHNSRPPLSKICFSLQCGFNAVLLPLHSKTPHHTAKDAEQCRAAEVHHKPAYNGKSSALFRRVPIYANSQ